MAARTAKTNSKKINPSRKKIIFSAWRRRLQAIKSRQQNFLARRPHRSFQLTRRRDYKRSLKLPGYWSFTNYVRRMLWSHKRLFITCLIIHAVITATMLGVMSQETFQLLNSTVNDIQNNALQADVGAVTANIAIVAGVAVGAFNSPLSEAQQIYAGFIGLLGWLVIVWLLRQILAGYKNVRFRDGLYSAGAPIISTFLVLLVVLIQLIPLSLAALAYVSAEAVTAFEDPLFTTLFWIIEVILILLSSYWLTSSLIALVVVTLPGMYPLKALRVAGDLVTGRRIRILYRILWLVGTLFAGWVIVLTFFVLLANIPFLHTIPMIPIAVLLLSSFSLIWSAAYLYLLYRKIVDDDADPA